MKFEKETIWAFVILFAVYLVLGFLSAPGIVYLFVGMGYGYFIGTII